MIDSLHLQESEEKLYQDLEKQFTNETAILFSEIKRNNDAIISKAEKQIRDEIAAKATALSTSLANPPSSLLEVKKQEIESEIAKDTEHILDSISATSL